MPVTYQPRSSMPATALPINEKISKHGSPSNIPRGSASRRSTGQRPEDSTMYWSWRAQNSVHSRRDIRLPDARISATSVK